MHASKKALPATFSTPAVPWPVACSSGTSASVRMPPITQSAGVAAPCTPLDCQASSAAPVITRPANAPSSKAPARGGAAAAAASWRTWFWRTVPPAARKQWAL